MRQPCWSDAISSLEWRGWCASDFYADKGLSFTENPYFCR